MSGQGDKIEGKTVTKFMRIRTGLLPFPFLPSVPPSLPPSLPSFLFIFMAKGKDNLKLNSVLNTLRL